MARLHGPGRPPLPTRTALTGRRVQIEQRQEGRLIRQDAEDGAPPRTGIDLDAGRAVLKSRGRGTS
ncbi:DUF6191 domain-containing protein [Streptomyces sp. NPDC056944]|uniref:DUF6191 domain-containing protein n=1 Tax=Streptomyces sp. NPDC056944 TaxID=3345972 RepID=UPI00363666D0